MSLRWSQESLSLRIPPTDVSSLTVVPYAKEEKVSLYNNANQARNSVKTEKRGT